VVVGGWGGGAWDLAAGREGQRERQQGGREGEARTGTEAKCIMMLPVAHQWPWRE
jgi:hypothetical protein